MHNRRSFLGVPAGAFREVERLVLLDRTRIDDRPVERDRARIDRRGGHFRTLSRPTSLSAPLRELRSRLSLRRSGDKFLAKIASDLNKPKGQAGITPRAGPAFVEALAVKEFHGVGPAAAAKMEKIAILTGADLKARPLALLIPAEHRHWRGYRHPNEFLWIEEAAMGVAEQSMSSITG